MGEFNPIKNQSRPKDISQQLESLEKPIQAEQPAKTKNISQQLEEAEQVETHKQGREKIRQEMLEHGVDIDALYKPKDPAILKKLKEFTEEVTLHEYAQQIIIDVLKNGVCSPDFDQLRKKLVSRGETRFDFNQKNYSYYNEELEKYNTDISIARTLLSGKSIYEDPALNADLKRFKEEEIQEKLQKYEKELRKVA